MDTIITTPRLKLTLVEKAPLGSQEFEWYHHLRSDEQTMFFGISGVSKTREDTDQKFKFILPLDEIDEGKKESYRVVYAVHEILNVGSVETAAATSTLPANAAERTQTTRHIGFVNLRSLDKNTLPLPAEYTTIPASAASTTLTLELAYMFLPPAWGKGYATESVQAVLKACKATLEFWSPWTQVYVRALVNPANPASMRVMDKVGMKRSKMYEWSGKAVFLRGEWREKDWLYVYGMYLIE